MILKNGSNIEKINSGGSENSRLEKYFHSV
jgi:hypothetical protein